MIFKKFIKYALALGGVGFMWFHLVRRCVREGYWVRSVDLKYAEIWHMSAWDFKKLIR